MIPQIHVEPADHSTDLCAIMGRQGSDKGNAENTARHDYTRYYKAIFSPIRETVTRVFELGIFCGSSLRGWRDYFPNAAIFGADIDPGMVNSARGDRIATFCCDETDEGQVAALWAAVGSEGVLFDIILDDALHTYADNARFFEWSRHMLKPSGIYIMEDCIPQDLDKYRALAVKLRAEGWAAHLMEMPRHDGAGEYNGETVPDNALFVLRAP